MTAEYLQIYHDFFLSYPSNSLCINHNSAGHHIFEKETCIFLKEFAIFDTHYLPLNFTSIPLFSGLFYPDTNCLVAFVNALRKRNFINFICFSGSELLLQALFSGKVTDTLADLKYKIRFNLCI